MRDGITLLALALKNKKVSKNIKKYRKVLLSKEITIPENEN